MGVFRAQISQERGSSLLGTPSRKLAGCTGAALGWGVDSALPWPAQNHRHGGEMPRPETGWTALKGQCHPGAGQRAYHAAGPQETRHCEGQRRILGLGGPMAT